MHCINRWLSISKPANPVQCLMNYHKTASNAEESSYACYYDAKRQTYLGDLYSVNWMEDSDAEDITKETLFKQFQVTKANTNLSHVMEYGDLVCIDM